MQITVRPFYTPSRFTAFQKSTVKAPVRHRAEADAEIRRPVGTTLIWKTLRVGNSAAMEPRGPDLLKLHAFHKQRCASRTPKDLTHTGLRLAKKADWARHPESILKPITYHKSSKRHKVPDKRKTGAIARWWLEPVSEETSEHDEHLSFGGESSSAQARKSSPCPAGPPTSCL